MIAKFTNSAHDPRHSETGDAPKPTPKGARYALRAARLAENIVAREFEVSLSGVRAPTRGAPTHARARQMAMYLAHVGLGLDFTRLGRAFRRDRTTIAHAARAVEDMRDDPDIDRRLDALERALREGLTESGKRT